MRPPDLSYITNYLCLRLLKDHYVIGIHGKFLKGLQLLFEAGFHLRPIKSQSNGPWMTVELRIS